MNIWRYIVVRYSPEKNYCPSNMFTIMGVFQNRDDANIECKRLEAERDGIHPGCKHPHHIHWWQKKDERKYWIDSINVNCN
jgi:hypothetical protein